MTNTPAVAPEQQLAPEKKLVREITGLRAAADPSATDRRGRCCRCCRCCRCYRR